jgi:hypothetical protein
VFAEIMMPVTIAKMRGRRADVAPLTLGPDSGSFNVRLHGYRF